MKANFKFDPDFPDIDGSGHSDKIGWCNVKGGGSTNTTMFDPLEPGLHFYSTWRDFVAVSSGSAGLSYASCNIDPDFGNGAVANPGALNAVGIGDNYYQRASDRILLNRIIVNGSIVRPKGQSQLTAPSLFTPPVLPKVLVLLFADLDPQGGAVDCDKVLESASAPHVAPQYSGLPFLNSNWLHRYRVLASDVIDFERCPQARSEYLLQPISSTSTGGPLPIPEVTLNDVNEDIYFWENCSMGFRFDVSLNDALCCFNGGPASDGLYSSLSNISLHMMAVLFDGVSLMGFLPAGGDFNYVDLQYQSVLYFKDFLSPSAACVAAGPDGGVVQDDAFDPLDLLADESARMAGAVAPERPHKRTKASVGMFNFRPRGDPALLSFPDDFEFSQLRNRSKRKGNRRVPFTKRYRFDDEDAPEPVYKRR